MGIIKYLRLAGWKRVTGGAFLISVTISALSDCIANGIFGMRQIVLTVLFLGCAALLLCPPYWYLKSDNAILWSKWSGMIGKPERDRKARAMREELTPLSIDADLGIGYFAGSHEGRYKTTLRSCSCPDFQKRRVPCKHMFYLAMRCGVEEE